MRGPHPFLRTVVVVLASAWFIVSDIPQLAQFWHTYGQDPFYEGGYIDDSRDWRSVSMADRVRFIGLGVAATPGESFVLPPRVGTREHAVTGVATRLEFTTYDAIIAGLSFAGTVLIVLVAGWLVLYRPSPITWAFFGLGPFYGPNDWTFSIAVFPPVLAALQALIFALIAGLGLWGCLYFGLAFPSGADTPVKRFLARWSWLGWPILSIEVGWMWVIFAVFGLPEPLLLYRVGTIIGGLLFLGAVGAMGHTFATSRGLDRQRVKWVFASYALGFVPIALLWFSFAFGISTPVWFSDLGFLMTIFLPFAVAYTVIVHRVLDVNFIVSRAVVYGTLTSIIVGVFALVDWLLGSVLAQTRLAVVVEILAAIGLGFGLNGLHARVDRLVDATLFRDRHRAEKRLTRVANAIAHAGSVEAVEDMLVDEPSEALHLASAAVFRADGNGTFGRTTALHWSNGEFARFEPDDRLLALLRAEQGPLPIDETGWSAPDLPHGAARPVLALPIVFRHDLRAIVLYGAHESGEAIDPDEIKLMEKIASMASAAVEHLEAVELRRQVGAMAQELARYRASAGLASS
ncbi:MAG TPA: hypothetical protein VEJ20_02275 [Candidatus Eremiobacteraceae bacterium]|nr:hypothetical protein [Candidatus Eremiobacteraceae bacterium]